METENFQCCCKKTNKQQVFSSYMQYTVIEMVPKGKTLCTETTQLWLHWFPRQMTPEKRAQKFHTDDMSLPRSG